MEGHCREIQAAHGDAQKKQHVAKGTEHNLILEEAGIPRIRHRMYSLKLAEFYQRSLLSSDAAVDPPNQALETGSMYFVWQAQFLNSYFEVSAFYGV